MAFSLLLFTWTLLVTTCAPSAQEFSSGHPRFTNCRSPELETFTCRWTYGDFHNLTGGVKVIFMVRNDLIMRECPDYESAGENSCYFNSSYTSTGPGYCLRLVHENTTLDEYCFTVEDIFQPDPPIGLNWTLLNHSVVGAYALLQVRWKPPASAIRHDWIDLVYELQYKDVNKTEWNKLDIVNATSVEVDFLRVDQEYEFRVRCRGTYSENFGEFSKVRYISLAQFSSGRLLDEQEFPWPLFIIFGTLGGAAVLLLIRFTKQRGFRPCTKRKFVQRDAGTYA